MKRSSIWSACAPILLVTLALVSAGGAGALGTESVDPFARAASTPLAEGMNTTLIGLMLDAISRQNARPESPDRIDSVIVIRHGNVVVEEYPDRLQPASLVRPLSSVTQSVMSLVVGIALDRGLIADLQVPVLSSFPDALGAPDAAPRDGITIEHLLDMTSGLEWTEAGSFETESDIPVMEESRDPVAYVLKKSVVAAPGEQWLESSGSAHVLSALLSRITGAPASYFARELLFDPITLGATPWREDKAGNTRGWTGLSMTPRDLARIGILCLERGAWNGHQVVSAEWVAASTQEHVPTPTEGRPSRGYGYHWWVDAEAGIFYAEASEAAGLYVCPTLDLVVVFTGALPRGHIAFWDLVTDYVLPAARSETLALGNPSG